LYNDNGKWSCHFSPQSLGKGLSFIIKGWTKALTCLLLRYKKDHIKLQQSTYMFQPIESVVIISACIIMFVRKPSHPKGNSDSASKDSI